MQLKPEGLLCVHHCYTRFRVIIGSLFVWCTCSRPYHDPTLCLLRCFGAGSRRLPWWRLWSRAASASAVYRSILLPRALIDSSNVSNYLIVYDQQHTCKSQIKASVYLKQFHNSCAEARLTPISSAVEAWDWRAVPAPSTKCPTTVTKLLVFYHFLVHMWSDVENLSINSREFFPADLAERVARIWWHSGRYPHFSHYF